DDKKVGKFIPLSVGPLLAEAIIRVHEEESVSYLFS
ncbi:ribose-phosphate pyrophosphokinase, partial [Bacillus altitudinis]|nr:ribose-phosphate pyrophosphokinase [Bacillus altitudinis]